MKTLNSVFCEKICFVILVYRLFKCRTNGSHFQFKFGLLSFFLKYSYVVDWRRKQVFPRESKWAVVFWMTFSRIRESWTFPRPSPGRSAGQLFSLELRWAAPGWYFTVQFSPYVKGGKAVCSFWVTWETNQLSATHLLLKGGIIVHKMKLHWCRNMYSMCVNFIGLYTQSF